ncbi:hypothetical protein A1OU_14405 [Enterovibrio norvegicus]|nr:hypothetical protein A1OU_14405 [Enterovibrio norvegicus]
MPYLACNLDSNHSRHVQTYPQRVVQAKTSKPFALSRLPCFDLYQDVEVTSDQNKQASFWRLLLHIIQLEPQNLACPTSHCTGFSYLLTVYHLAIMETITLLLTQPSLHYLAALLIEAELIDNMTGNHVVEVESVENHNDWRVALSTCLAFSSITFMVHNSSGET